ncbi:endoplasmic reticulum membrane sensor NFE2L1-like [Melanotaenia boesemani]|uniref:endoplasmic reticulum membrane sensor NFE2L1-like n=1 Tax=Melanotaenia boesemani TaxID=1250792 RepID=UPI001C047B2B|nr:endoplasmic reticulum membrane sensor NFE2L1-like [Melanotaenia boesemani]
MLYQKKYLSEGLIQMAILLSLCGIKLDVGLDSYLPRSWYDMIQGPTSALTQTQFHNLRNRLEDGHSLNPKSVDLDRFFTAQRLLDWVRSLDRLQVPHAEVETWLVQREPHPFPLGRQHQFSLMEGAPPQGRSDHTSPTVEPQANLEEDEDGEDEELGDAAGRYVDSESPSVVPDGPSMDLDLEDQWQDLLAILEPENLDSRPDGNLNAVGSDGNVIQQLDQQNLLTGMASQHDLLGTGNQSDLGLVLLSLTPSSELDNHGDLPAEDFFMGLNPEDNLVNMDPSSPDFKGMLEPESLSEAGVNFPSFDLVTPSFITTLEGNYLSQDLLGPSDAFLLDEEGVDGLCSPLGDLLEDASILDAVRMWDPVLEAGFDLEMAAGLEEEGCDYHAGNQPETGREDQNHPGSPEDDSTSFPTHTESFRTFSPSPALDSEDEMESDSGLSLDFSHSPVSSSCVSNGSSSSSSSPWCGSAAGSLFSENEDEDAEDSFGSEMEVEENLEELGAVGGCSGDVKNLFPVRISGNHELFHRLSWQEHVSHDHTYNQDWSSTTSLSKMLPRRTKSQRSFSSHITGTKFWSRDEQRARALRVPFSNQRIVSMPVEEFNDLLSRFQLNEEQLTLIRDIRRRGKNKIAAQNCRKRKQDVLQGLEDEVSGLRRHRSQLLRERREALRNLQEMKSRFGMLSQEIFSKLRDKEGKPLNATEYILHFGSSDGDAAQMADKDSKKPRHKD